MHKEREISYIRKELIVTMSVRFGVLYWLHALYGETAYRNIYTMLTIERFVNRIVPISAFFLNIFSNISCWETGSLQLRFANQNGGCRI